MHFGVEGVLFLLRKKIPQGEFSIFGLAICYRI